MKMRLGAAVALTLSLLAAAPALAQTGQDTRLDRLEKQLKEMRSIIFQGRETGQPVIVKPEGPDPAVTALQSRVDDMDQSIRRLSGQLELANHDADEARKAAQQSHDAVIEVRAQLQASNDRIQRLESQLTAQPQPQPQAAVEPPPQPVPRGADATARAQAQDREVLGGPPTAAAGNPETASYRNAIALQEQGDYAGASLAWQDYITRYGNGARGKEARYRLGESLYIQSDYGQAARAYAEALKGWPKTAWAPDATVKLSAALAQLGRRDEACSVVGEFDTRYGPTAPAAVKGRAKGVRVKAACTAA